MNDLAQQAINCALNSDWKTACSLNLQIVKNNKKDLAALNRLAKAYSELGDRKNAILIAKKVLAIDPYNKIALKSLDKWKQLKAVNGNVGSQYSAKEFIEEPGKTRIVQLLHLGDSNVIAGLDSGDEVKLDTHAHRISVSTSDGKYIGRLPDDLSLRLKSLIMRGNTYKALIKNIEKKEVRLFLKETHRDAKVKDVPSFPSEKIDYVAFTPPSLVHKNKVEESVLESEE